MKSTAEKYRDETEVTMDCEKCKAIVRAEVKADICREFFKKLRLRMRQGRDTSYQGMCDFGYELLEEMGNEE